jgi:hypothetical protein
VKTLSKRKHRVLPFRSAGLGLITALSLLIAGTLCPAIELILGNTEPLVDSDGTTKLRGNAASGDLVQLILVGPNGKIDPPDSNGDPSGDDSLFAVANNPTHVGVGAVPDQGLLSQGGMNYDASAVGSNAYVRFWNAPTPGSATYYGNSKTNAIPPDAGFGQAEYDFAANAADPHTTDIPIGIPKPMRIGTRDRGRDMRPVLAGLGPAGLVLGVLWRAARRSR